MAMKDTVNLYPFPQNEEIKIQFKIEKIGF